MTALRLDDDRALPAEANTRAAAREIYAAVRELPLLCLHGHVDAGLLARDEPFGDPATLFVVPDHYLVRMLVSQGFSNEDLGVARRDGGPVETDPRAIWRRFCEHWHLFRGTPTRFWLEHELVEVFGVTQAPGAGTADALYDELSEKLADPAFRPRALFDRFRIEVLATTDPATAELAEHASLAAEGWGEKVDPDLPAGRGAARRAARLAAGPGPAARAGRGRGRRLRRLPGGVAPPPADLRRGRRAGHRPRPPEPVPDPAVGRRGAADLRRRARG